MWKLGQLPPHRDLLCRRCTPSVERASLDTTKWLFKKAAKESPDCVISIILSLNTPAELKGLKSVLFDLFVFAPA